jgi:hypothetical protein
VPRSPDLATSTARYIESLGVEQNVTHRAAFLLILLKAEARS